MTSVHLLTVLTPTTIRKETHLCHISQNLTNPSKTSATSGAALVALTAPAFLASQAHADTNPALNSPE